MTTRRTKEITIKTRKDVTVKLEDGTERRYKDAVGWGLVQNLDVLSIYGDRVPDGDKFVNELLGMHRKWASVDWT